MRIDKNDKDLSQQENNKNNNIVCKRISEILYIRMSFCNANYYQYSITFQL